ncbi:putative aminotransferase, class I/classII, tyrosine/nicotianamine aminotransferase [Helianthus annuus]|nr:putative aminotransferase, class I/classII, tyrosine/nicotianamine aminotransferase [Helianthus annuus]KAJ0633336.1 putative aminotransferase, class I/classII, tyrosine/nicotianamine aminotransferase [Helianthus annuus]KAJ0827445.1 putative aminotransferase, class I/classII, tyrosine/nicotianamine aminotransferase [Helianthus annuus]
MLHSFLHYNNNNLQLQTKMGIENGSTLKKKWGFRLNRETNMGADITIRGVRYMLMSKLNKSDTRPVLPLAHGDPSAFACFRTTQVAEDALVDSIRSGNFNGYGPGVGILPARRAVAEYLSQDLPTKLSEDDVFLTVGCAHAIQTILTVLANPNANILLPKPGFPYYEAVAKSCHLEVRHFDLLPEKDWEVDLDAVEALADENTVAMVIINPGNPCGNIFTHQHLEKVAKTAKKLGILVISDEVYDHLAFGKNPFVPMGTFGSITPVITLGSISKRWIVPGWRLGWLAINDPNGILKEHGIIDCIAGHISLSCDPPTFIQGAIPDILGKTKEDFFLKIISIIKDNANSCYEGLADVPGVVCPSKPEGSMFVMAKLDLSVFEDIKDDLDFCLKLAKEESVIILPGITVGLKNWLRITFAIEPSALEDGIKRLKAFCERHSIKA